MKTVINRALSFVMCLILICSTVSVAAFGAGAAESFSYKTYAQNATKENVHHLLDVVDDALKKENIRFEVEELNIVIDLTSVDAICATLDEFRTAIKIFKGLLGDLKNLNLDVFDKGMSRAGSGDVKIFSEVLELANANFMLVEEILSEDGLDLGVVGTVAKIENIKIDLSTEVKKGIVDALFDEGDANYAAAKNRALTNFDSFVYTDVMSLVSKEGGILEGISINEKTTIDHLITDVFNILVNKHLIGLVKGVSFSFASLGSEYAKLDSIVQVDGSYDFSKIKFTKDETVLKQINNVLGEVFAQLVPSYEAKWVKGDYTKIGNNVRGLVKYIASESGLIDIKGKSDEALMLEIIKLIFQAADTNGEKEIYEAIKNTKTLTEAADKIVIQLSGKSYPAGTTYEHVVGDWLIGELEDTIPLYDVDGKAINAGKQKTAWEVLNSVLNFFLIDKNLDAYFGWKLTRNTTFFEKLDLILDYTANDGSANFNSKTYITSLINSIFTVNLQKFVELTAVKALNFAGKESVVTFLYKTVYNLLNNWSDSTTALKYYSSQPFNNALSDSGLANIVKVLIETLSNRSESTAWLVGVAYGAIDDVFENVTKAGLTPTCTSNGYAPTKKCTRPECKGVVFSDSKDVIASRGHKYNSGVITTAPKCTTDGTKTFTCLICGHSYGTKVNKLGHKAGAYVYKRPEDQPTYEKTGKQESRCTVCNAYLNGRTIPRLTLAKPTGLKAQALSTTSIKYSWNPVKGATSYTLYYKTNTGSWKSVTVKNKKTSVTVKKLKAGLTYKFKVVAVAGSNKSKESATVESSTKPSAVTLKALRSKKKKEVVVEWKKISGVTGYEVQHATDKKFKKNKKTVTIKKAGTVKTIIKKLKSKKTYYVRVRAYKTVNKVKVYGAYSKVKSIKCK